MKRRTKVLGVALAGALIVTPFAARADLSFGELEDFLELLMEPADLSGWTDALGPVLDTIGRAGNTHLDGGFDWTLFPTQYPVTVEQTVGYATARGEDRLDRVEEAMMASSRAVDQIMRSVAWLEGLDVLNLTPVSIFAAQQIGNRTAALTTQALGQIQAVLTETAQVQVDQLAMEDYSRQVAVAQAQAFYGAEGFAGGGVEPHTMNLAW